MPYLDSLTPTTLKSVTNFKYPKILYTGVTLIRLFFVASYCYITYYRLLPRDWCLLFVRLLPLILCLY